MYTGATRMPSLKVWIAVLLAMSANLALGASPTGAAGTGPGVAAGAAAPDGYHLLRQVPLPGVTGWDYLAIDPERRRLFISDNAGALVIDIDTLHTVGTVPEPATLPGVGLVHGVAFAPDLLRGFLSHEIPPSVLVFDLDSLKVLGQAPTDAGADAVVYDSHERRLFTLNGKDEHVHDASVIDAASARALGNVPLGGRPEFGVVDGAGHLYVNIASRSEIASIDTHSLEVTGTWSVKPCREPGGLAIDTAHRRLFATCDNRLMIMIDADTGRVLGSVRTGTGSDAAAFDAETGDVFASSDDGTVTIARESNPDTLELLGQVRTAPSARTMALDPVTHRLFLVAAQFEKPPAHPTPDNPHGYPRAKAGTARLLIVGR